MKRALVEGENMKKEPPLNIEGIISKFEGDEEDKNTRRGAFKIEAPFDEALKEILKAKPEKAKRHKKGQNGKS